MIILPAIDMMVGLPVRLYQGAYESAAQVADDVLKTALSFEKAGAEWIHMVDLDGAKDGQLVNFETIRRIVEEVDLFVEVGGGIRDEDRIRQYLDLGVDRVILGTIAIKEPEFLKEMVAKYGEKIVVGVDARDGYVAINGWKEITDQESFSFCEYLRGIGVKTVIYTDISRDGGLEGTNMEAYKKLQQIEGLEVTASGGISFEREITELKDIVSAAILGKAIYSGALDLARAVELAE